MGVMHLQPTVFVLTDKLVAVAHLQEFFALLSFVAPDLLGAPQTFTRVS